MSQVADKPIVYPQNLPTDPGLYFAKHTSDFNEDVEMVLMEIRGEPPFLRCVQIGAYGPDSLMWDDGKNLSGFQPVDIPPFI